jgi:uncharacterized 2Fe-2S/4Fe-4S cluster protein (DUF4445 family)
MTSFLLTLSPAGRRIAASEGAPLKDVLFDQGVEFPCGGHGRCKGCRVRVVRGRIDPSERDRAAFSTAELAEGWRLACDHAVSGDAELELAQWEMAVLGDETAFAFTPHEGLGIAVDLGTTTIAAQLLDLASGHVLGVRTALNAQSRRGADILSRAEYALRGGARELEVIIRHQIGGLVAELLHDAPAGALRRIALVGNSVMHHLFCGLDIAPLATHPFLPRHPEGVRLSAAELGWEIDPQTVVTFMPCIAGLVGADILAGIAATGLDKQDGLTALIDLGTNGEIVVARRGRMLCTSTAAGPAFEGARIAMGMRAATGAISEVELRDGALACRVIGGGEARGLCGSGLVDAVAAGLDLGRIERSGRLAEPLALDGPVVLTPKDVRELQLAKAAIAAGLRILTARLGATPNNITTLHLAGAFGNAINLTSAQRIGLLRLPVARVVAAGNTALQGAKRALFAEPDAWDALARRIEHVALNEEPSFQDVFAEEMRLGE